MDTKELLSTQEGRDSAVTQWRDEGFTQAQIAAKLGVTRQRVQQIERRLNLGLRRQPGTYKTYVFICPQCGKSASSRLRGRKYCSRECFISSRKDYSSPEEKKELDEVRRKRNRERSHDYYHNVFKKMPDWKKRLRDRNKKYSKKKR